MRSALVATLVLCGGAVPLQRLSARCSKSSGVWTCSTADWSSSGWVARAAFRPSQNETGWATLFVESAAGQEDAEASFSAGYLEGFFTAQLIWDSWVPLLYSTPQLGNAEDPMKSFVREQMNFLFSQVQSQSNRSDQEGLYWRSVGNLLLQLEGVAAGYNAARTSGLDVPALSLEQLMFLSMRPELPDIQMATTPSARKNFHEMEREEFFKFVRVNGHCSALFRVTPDLSDMLAAHTTWEGYIFMLRIFKSYTLRLSTSTAETVTFSGYPAAIAGFDDFYITSQKLVVIETTNSIFNNSLYDYVQPQSVPYWVRVSVATRNSDSGKVWHETFYKHNSGTYSNQWMVADYKKFTPKSPLLPWTFSVSEQLPGPYSHSGEDMTDVLQRGHWPSYNVAYFPDVYNISGYPEMVQKFGYGTSYQLAPRAPIYRRDAEKVLSLDTLQHFMRENNWGTGDPLATDACSAIACRGDLLLSGASLDGAIDAKLVNAEFMNAMSVSAIAGPTTQQQPPFAFTGQWSSEPHVGMPERYDFTWQTISPTSMGIDAPSSVIAV